MPMGGLTLSEEWMEVGRGKQEWVGVGAREHEKRKEGKLGLGCKKK